MISVTMKDAVVVAVMGEMVIIETEEASVNVEIAGAFINCCRNSGKVKH
jgi:hypothetical protein